MDSSLCFFYMECQFNEALPYSYNFKCPFKQPIFKFKMCNLIDFNCAIESDGDLFELKTVRVRVPDSEIGIYCSMRKLNLRPL